MQCLIAPPCEWLVTADEVNLDRFHNRIRKVCALGRTWLALVTASMGLYLVLPDRGLAENNQGSGIKLVGTYAFRDSGQVTVTLPGSTTPTVLPLEAAGRTTFFANGTLSGLVSFSLGGTIFKMVPLTGTFTVNGDGSVSETFTQLTPPGLTLTFIAYPTPDGNTVTFVETDPGSTVSGISTRGLPTGDQQ